MDEGEAPTDEWTKDQLLRRVRLLAHVLEQAVEQSESLQSRGDFHSFCHELAELGKTALRRKAATPFWFDE